MAAAAAWLDAEPLATSPPRKIPPGPSNAHSTPIIPTTQAPALDAFTNWPDGGLIMAPNPRNGDIAVTRLERYKSSIHVGHPTAAHAAWEASQAKWAAVAAEADADEAAATAAAGEGGWVPQPGAGVPTNQYLIHFESDLFVGKMMVYLKNLPSSHEPYFDGKKRRSVLMIQGRFKKPLWVENVVSGQEFERPYSNMRGCWLMEKVRGAFESLGLYHSLSGLLACSNKADLHLSSPPAFEQRSTHTLTTPNSTHIKRTHQTPPNPPTQVVIACAKKIVSAMELGDIDRAPSIRFPLMALSHVTNVSLPGQVRGWGCALLHRFWLER